MKVLKVREIEYDSYIYTPQIDDNENYVLDNNILSKNCQNMSKKTMQLIMSRLDKNCKIIILGSNKQIDNPFINKYNNALTTIIKASQNEKFINDIYYIELKNVLRGPITEIAEQIFT